MNTLKGMASGKKHTAHNAVKLDDVFDHYQANWGKKTVPIAAKKAIVADAKELMAWAKKNKVQPKNRSYSGDNELGIGNAEDFAKFWKDHEKKHGETSKEGKRLVMSIAALSDELHGGFGRVKDDYADDFNYEFQSKDEEK